MNVRKAKMIDSSLLLLIWGVVLLIPLLPACSLVELSLPRSPTPTPQPSWYRSMLGPYIPPNRPIAGEKVTLETAQSRLPFALPLPSYLPGNPEAAYLAEIWATPSGSDLPSLALVYGVGVTIIVHRELNPTNWHNLADPPFVSINVNGHPGIGKDPGDRILDNGSTWHYNGSVSWQVGELQLAVYGEYPMSELLKVAESMEIPEN